MTHGPSIPEAEAAPAPPAVGNGTSSLDEGGIWTRGRRSLTVGLVLTVTLVAFETLAVATVMPIVTGELGDLFLYGWVFTAFFLGTLLGTIVLGGMADRRGLVAPFAIGLLLFAVGLVVGGAAPSMLLLVVGRFIQGLGGGAITPVAYVAISRTMGPALRARMFALLATAWVVPALLGPALAGVIGELTSWRVVFLGLLPLVVLSGIVTVAALARVEASVPAPASTVRDGRGERHRSRALLAVTIVVGAGVLTAGLTSVSVLPGVPLVAVGLALTVAAFRRLTPAGTLRAAPGLPAAILLRGLLTFAFFITDAYVPLALQDWRGTSAVVSGIALTAASLAWTVGAWIQAHTIIGSGARVVVRSGFLVVVAGIVGFALVLQPDVPVPVGIVAWALTGLGMGLAYSAQSLVTLGEAPPGEAGSASAALQLSDMLGTALGAGVGGALITAGSMLGLDGWVGLGAAFAVGGVVAVLAVPLVGRLPGRPVTAGADVPLR